MQKTIPTLIIGLAVIVAAAVLGKNYNYKYQQQKAISVTGSAEVNFTSDIIVWEGSYSRKAATLEQAFASLKADEEKVRSFLNEKGLKSDQVIFSAVNTNKDYETLFDANGRMTGQRFTGYTLTQDLKVQSSEIEKVENISREITGLIQSGVELRSSSPDYYYSKLSDLKIELLSKASADGRTRAETIASKSGNKIKGLKKAEMGVFQITGQYQNEDYTWGGVLNTTSKEKTASITVRMDFELK